MTRVTQAHIDARMAAIQEAAVSLFVCKGISGTTMQDIAAEAGISTGAIYRYYPSKESLLQAVLVQGIEQSRALFDEAAAATNSPLEALEAVGRVVWCGLEADGGRAHIILELEAILAAARQSEQLGAELDLARSAVIDMIERLVRASQAAGEIDRSIDARALAVMLAAVVSGLRILSLELEGGIRTGPMYDLIAKMLEGFAPKAEERLEPGAASC